RPASNTATATATPTWETCRPRWSTVSRAGYASITASRRARPSPPRSITSWRPSPAECTARCVAPWQGARSRSTATASPPPWRAVSSASARPFASSRSTCTTSWRSRRTVERPPSARWPCIRRAAQRTRAFRALSTWAGTRGSGWARRSSWGGANRTRRPPRSRGGSRTYTLVPEELAGIDGLAPHLDLVVEVRARGASGVAGEGDDLPALDGLPLLDADLLEVTVERAETVAVVQDDGRAVLAPVAREVHRAGGRREHGGAAASADVEPAVELLVARPGRWAHPEAGVQRAAHWPSERQRHQHGPGALHEVLERTQALTTLAPAAAEQREGLRQRGRLAGEDHGQHRDRAAHAGALAGDAGRWTERAPHPDVRLLPRAHFTVDLGHALLEGVQQRALLLDSSLDARRLQLGLLEREVVPPGAAQEAETEQDAQLRAEQESAGAAHVQHAGATAVDQHEGEPAAALHERFRGTTETSRAAWDASGFGIRQ